ncbi:EAL domain-containing protein [Pelomonas sp. KK5]|uniref:EAL domain-containing protein n=1 Tax=Pelomonas sp. KK5 TaxID=1855730 RepID=UPI0009FB8FD8|nr:EAL domain-containing protein [Pelomonas sp. KK5]
MDDSHWSAGALAQPARRMDGLALAGRLLLVAAAYYAAARLGLLIPYVNTQVSLVWLPSGIALAALWRWGAAMLPAVFLAGAAINAHIGSPLWVAACTALGNSCGPWFSAWLLRAFAFDDRLLRRRDIAAFLAAVLLGMLVTSTNGIVWLLASGLLDAAQLRLAWLSWLGGDAVGALLAGIPLMALGRAPAWRPGREGAMDGLLQGLLLASVLLVFSGRLSADSALIVPLLALPFCGVALLALRGGLLASSLAVLLLSLAAAWGTARGAGPFAGAQAGTGLLALWSYITAQACTSLLICGLVTELQGSRRQFAALMQHAQDAILVVEPDGRLVRVNPAAAALLGAAPGQMLADLPQGSGALLVGLLTEPAEQVTRVLQLARPDGRRAQLECQLARYRDGSGLWQSHLILRDITVQEEAKARLAASEAWLKTITDHLPVLVAYADRTQTYRFANGRFRVVMGVEPERVIEQTMGEFLGPVAHGELQPHIEAALRGEAQRFERTGWARNANTHFHTEYVPDLMPDGQVAGFFIMVLDITERRQAELELARSQDRLREQAELLQVTLKSIGDGVITTDEQGRIRWMNPPAERMCGWQATEAAGRQLAEVFRIVDADSREPAPDPVAACLQGQGATSLRRRSVLLAREGGNEHAIEESAAPIRVDEGRLLGAVLVFRDVAEQRRLSDQLAHRATHDALTGLLNRAGFQARLERLLGQQGGGAAHGVLMFVDLDHFKAVNDACGHAQGDRLLCEVSALMARCVRTRDTLARLGGDEFGVLLEHCGPEQALRVAQSICEQVGGYRFAHEGRQFRIGSSIGLVPVDGRWSSRAALLDAADKACYAAKAAGRNRVHVWDEADRGLQARAGESDWRRRIEAALAQERFQLFGQRVLRPDGSSDAEGLHIEVLLRLQEEPEGPLIAPMAFLPAAERFGLAAPIDRWVLARAIGWLASRQREVACLSVNLSAQALADAALPGELRQWLAEAAVEPARLCIELAESAVHANPGAAAAFCEALHAIGVQLALDDFGGGAASDAPLKALAGIAWLKIEPQRLRHLPQQALDRAMVRCVQEMAEAIGARTVAKGVETEAAAAALRGLGVDRVQGWLHHRPQPLERLLDD